MTFKFYPRPPVIARALCAVWLLTAAAPLSAQSPPAPASPGSARKFAYVRFLNLLPLDGGSLDLFSAAAANGPALKTAPPSNFYMGYINLVPGRASFQICRPGNRATPVKTVDIPLRGDAYYTLLAYLRPDGQPTVDVLDDTPDFTKPATNQLTVRQFLRGAQVVATVNNASKTDPLPYAGAQTLPGLADGAAPLTVAATTQPNNLPRLLNMEVNFLQARHATLYIVTDPYDRMRPRMTTDGPSRKDEDAARAHTNADTTAAPLQ